MGLSGDIYAGYGHPVFQTQTLFRVPLQCQCMFTLPCVTFKMPFAKMSSCRHVKPLAKSLVVYYVFWIMPES